MPHSKLQQNVLKCYKDLLKAAKNMPEAQGRIRNEFNLIKMLFIFYSFVIKRSVNFCTIKVRSTKLRFLNSKRQEFKNNKGIRRMDITTIEYKLRYANRRLDKLKEDNITSTNTFTVIYDDKK